MVQKVIRPTQNRAKKKRQIFYIVRMKEGGHWKSFSWKLVLDILLKGEKNLAEDMFLDGISIVKTTEWRFQLFQNVIANYVLIIWIGGLLLLFGLCQNILRVPKIYISLHVDLDHNHAQLKARPIFRSIIWAKWYIKCYLFRILICGGP